MSNGNGLDAVVAIFGTVIVAIIMLSLFSVITCVSEKSQISQLSSSISACDQQLGDITNDLKDWQSKYQKLIDENVTKQGFVDLKIQINDLNYQLIETNYQLISINRQVQNFNNVMNLNLTINFILLPLTLLSLFDFALLDFTYSKKIRSFGVRICHSIRSKVIVSDSNKLGGNSG